MKLTDSNKGIILQVFSRSDDGRRHFEQFHVQDGISFRYENTGYNILSIPRCITSNVDFSWLVNISSCNYIHKPATQSSPYSFMLSRVILTMMTTSIINDLVYMENLQFLFTGSYRPDKRILDELP